MIEAAFLAEIALIDTHVHRIHPHRAPDFGHFSGGYIDGPNQAENARQTILYGMVMEALRRRFGMPEGTPPAAVEAERNRRYGANPQGYFTDLIAGQNVEAYCLEIGSPIGGPAYTPEEIDYFNASLPAEKRRYIVRIDRVMDDVLALKAPFGTFLADYDRTLAAEIERRRTVGLKSCAAYCGGLAVEIVSRGEAEAAYEAVRCGRATPVERKRLHNYMLLHSVDAARAYDLPIQMHTGSGGGNYLDFLTQSPLHLIDFLRHDAVKNRVKIVLLHGGHPHEEDAGYLVSQFAHVYTDFSGMFYLSSLKAVERMAALLERTPLNKVMYGSDGVMFPEGWWFAEGHFRTQLGRLLNGMVAEGYLTETRGREVARLFMRENALACYTKIKEASI